MYRASSRLALRLHMPILDTSKTLIVSDLSKQMQIDIVRGTLNTAGRYADASIYHPHLDNPDV